MKYRILKQKDKIIRKIIAKFLRKWFLNYSKIFPWIRCFLVQQIFKKFVSRKETSFHVFSFRNKHKYFEFVVSHDKVLGINNMMFLPENTRNLLNCYKCSFLHTFVLTFSMFHWLSLRLLDRSSPPLPYIPSQDLKPFDSMPSITRISPWSSNLSLEFYLCIFYKNLLETLSISVISRRTFSCPEGILCK